ncbi:hypothetical protein AR158_c555L [Paramecium bursaria Chlorella virus AR158]|uniref:hypothetical protein n=1 Tax=Paramecium bursaria Chlorella virus AR158 TaxID=380598 RepID=UPI00015AA763|nr:hypothetical protein AR158_c555L [Paramecium bursaria Chlorella virus AR158]ABU44100.1 hypothetical protein AR158_c555L [Paramecium bursaria Chlorella virus AR158]
MFIYVRDKFARSLKSETKFEFDRSEVMSLQSIQQFITKHVGYHTITYIMLSFHEMIMYMIFILLIYVP